MIEAKHLSGVGRKVAEPYAKDKTEGTPYVEIDGTQFQDWVTPGALREAVLAAGGMWGAPRTQARADLDFRVRSRHRPHPPAGVAQR